MPKDVTSPLKTAIRLIEKYGREVTLIRFDQTPADGLKPWAGPADPRATPDETVTIPAAFVEPTSLSSMGITTVDDDLLKRLDKVCLIAPAVGSSYDLSTFNEIIDDGTNHKIFRVSTLKPGNTVLLYIVMVAKK